MKEKKLEEGLKFIVAKMSEIMDKEDKENPIFDYILTNVKYLKSADEFNTMVVSPINRIIRLAVSTQYSDKNHLAESIYTRYSFFENNLSELCSQMYGSGCSADKARFLLRSAIKWKETGKLPIFDWKQEYTYHYPETGTPEQWMKLIEGLDRLYHGYNKEYLIALESLMSEYTLSDYKKGKDDKTKP